MTNEEKVQHWINLSDEDVKTAEVVLNGKRYLHLGFMCHQVIEKIFKAAYAKLKEEAPPYRLDLLLLAKKSGFEHLLTSEQIAIIGALNPLNIEARYPDYKNEQAKRLTRSVCTELFKQTKSLQQWIKEKILLRK
jgi:HEPN domain-containing protein